MGRNLVTLLTLTIAVGGMASADPFNSYTITNLTSDLPNVAAHQDTNLVNPWGLVSGPATPFWISDNGTGLSTVYNGSGSALPLVVTIPGGSDPTGIVFNGSSNFGGSKVLFATESGSIAGWTSGTAATVDANGDAGTVYKGLAIDQTGGLLYAANFGLGRIDVYDSSFQPVSLPGAFTDPTLPAGYAPFNIENINGSLYVSYAQTSGGTDEVDGPGLGFVDVYSLNGTFQNRVASQGALNAPWGMALAPANFGAFSNDLLIGNFGDGQIHAYNPVTDAFVGTLDGMGGNPIAVEGLWGLSFGNGLFGTNTNTLYFTAGIPGDGNVEDHGLFGSIDVANGPEPSQILVTCLGFALIAAVSMCRSARRRISS